MSDPIKPAIQGTQLLSPELGMWYTIGAEYEYEVLQQIVRADQPTACDIETAGLGVNARDIKCVTFASVDHAVILDPRDPVQAVHVRWAIQQLKELIFHNAAYDVPNLVIRGLMTVPDCNKVIDTLLYARLAEPDEITTKKSLTACNTRYLGMDPEDETMNQVFRSLSMKIADGYRRFDLDRPIYIIGAAMDAIATARLLPKVQAAARDRMTKGHPFTHVQLSNSEAENLLEREQIINRLLLRRSARGIRIDHEFLAQAQTRWEHDRNQAVDILGRAGVGPTKPAKLIEYLEREAALPANWPRTKTGKPSTTADHLATIDHPVAQAYVRLKEIDKVINDYLLKCRELAVDGRIHPQVNLLKAVTGRMSIGDPPLQQYPGDARGILLADEGDSLTSLDWSQIEPVIAANFARDHDMLAGYESGKDFYEGITEWVDVDRKMAKKTLLAQLYGEGITRLAADLGVTKDQAYELRDHIFETLPGTKRLIERVKARAKRHRLVMTMSGRILPVPSFEGNLAAYKAVNYLIQGSAYDVLAEALVKIENAGLADAVYLAMHDELVVSTAAAHDVQKIMEDPPERLCVLSDRVPILRTDRKDLGERWADA